MKFHNDKRLIMGTSKTGRLALNGGQPIVKNKSRWSWPPRYPGLGDLVKSYIDGGRPLSIQDQSGIIKEVEDELKRRFSRKHAIYCSSGTMALYSAFFALKINPGDEIICPTITYHASATPALHFGAHVVLVDVEEETGNASAEGILKSISSRTKCLVTNAMWGHPVEQATIKKICKQRDISWIEDCSHAQFSSYMGKPVGSWGEIACASLQGEKIVSGGEGGVFLTDSDELHDQAVLLGHNLKRSERCVINPAYKPIGRTGYGLKLRGHPLAALMVHDQLVNHVDEWMNEREDSLRRLSRFLNELPGLRAPVIRETTTSMGAWYGYKPWIDTKELRVSREKIAAALEAEGVEVSIPGSPPLHELALFDPERFSIRSYSKFDNSKATFPGAEKYTRGLLSIPTFTGQRDESLLQDAMRAFEKVWDNLGELQ